MLCVDWRFAFLKPPYSSLHFGRPFLTPYQIAIKFQELYPQNFQTIGKPIGGKGTGQQDSLAQYIAQNLSQRIKRIKSEAITNIEGRFLHRANLHSLKYEVNNQLIESSSKHVYDLSMFRLISKRYASSGLLAIASCELRLSRGLPDLINALVRRLR